MNTKTKLPEFPNRWQTTGSKIVYENPWMRVREDAVIEPGGKSSIYGVLTPKHHAIGIIPIDDEYYTYLVGQWRYPLKQYSWEIVEGGAPFGESHLDCAQRELKEETGLVADTWIPILDFYLSNCITDEEVHVFVAKNLTQLTASPDSSEDLQVVRIPFAEAYERVLNGEITDAISIAGIFKTEYLIRTGQI